MTAASIELLAQVRHTAVVAIVGREPATSHRPGSETSTLSTSTSQNSAATSQQENGVRASEISFSYERLDL